MTSHVTGAEHERTRDSDKRDDRSDKGDVMSLWRCGGVASCRPVGFGL